MKIRVIITAHVHERAGTPPPVETSITRSAESDEGDNPAFIASQAIKLIARTGWEISRALRTAYRGNRNAQDEALEGIRIWHNNETNDW